MSAREMVVAAMNARGWNQTDLAEVMGVNTGTVSRILNGKTGITAQNALRLRDALDLDPVTLMTTQPVERAMTGSRPSGAIAFCGECGRPQRSKP